MQRKNLFLGVGFIIILSIFLTACGNSQKQGEKNTGGNNETNNIKKDYDLKNLKIATGSTGGTYYPLGGSLANIIQTTTGIESQAITSNGSVENMALIKKKEVEVVFTQTDIATYASEGTLMFNGEKVDNAKGLGALYTETIQIITTEKSGIKSVEDLKGKSVSVGEAGSGTKANAEQILEMYGLTVNDLKTRNLSFDDSTTGIQDGTIDAAFITAGMPTGAVEGLAATEKVVTVPLDHDKIASLIKKYPYYTKETIPTGTYGIKDDTETVAVQAMLVVRGDLKDNLVYDMTKAIFEKPEKFTHVKGKMIKVENALNNIEIEIHPGAKKYFDEKGVSTK